MNDQEKPTVSSPTCAAVCCSFCGGSNVEEDWGAVTQGSIDYQYGDITCVDCKANVTIELRGEEVDWSGDKSGSVRLKAKWNKRASS